MSSKHSATTPIAARELAAPTRAALGAAVLLGAALFATQALAGQIVVNHDEWTLSDDGYSLAGGSNAHTFATNLVGFLDGNGAGGNVLIYSDNFGLTGSSFRTSLDNAGYSATVSTTTSFDLATLQGYDAVFLGGGAHSKDDAVLAEYVNGGGGVYIAAGTGFGNAAVEAARWNGFLAAYGLEFGSQYNGVDALLAPGSDHPLFAGVERLYFLNGNSVSADGDIPNASIRMSNLAGIGMVGIYASGASDSTNPSGPSDSFDPSSPSESSDPSDPSDPSGSINSVPLPGTLSLLALGLAGFARRRPASAGAQRD